MRLSINQIDAGLFRAIPPLKRKSGNQGTKKTNFQYKDCVCAFDIETTRYGDDDSSDCAIMYIWQFQIGLDVTIVGRSWKEFHKLIRMIKDGLEDGERLVVYVHNLSYEFQFLRDNSVLGRDIDARSVFLLSSRKVLRFMTKDAKLEFRCSYIHSNMSLDVFTDKMNVEHKKLSGKEYDYDKPRFPWTPMTPRELDYACNDVQGLVEAIVKEMSIDGDNLYTIPLTSTGYVRRDIRAAVREGLPKGWVQERKPDFETYRLLREAFRGGNTHASRFNSNRVIEGPIYEYDRSSSYPDVQLNGKFPVSKFHNPKEVTKKLFTRCIEQGYCVVARLEFTNMRIRGDGVLQVQVPYISKSKCLDDKGMLDRDAIEDNGRIVFSPKVTISVTEVDLEIILRQYVFDEMRVLDFRFANKGSLPECIKEVIRKYYRMKTELKGKPEFDILYMKSKNKLNSIYGNSAQDPGKISVLYRPDARTVDGYIEGFYNRKTGEEQFFRSLRRLCAG